MTTEPIPCRYSLKRDAPVKSQAVTIHKEKEPRRHPLRTGHRRKTSSHGIRENFTSYSQTVSSPGPRWPDTVRGTTEQNVTPIPRVR